MPRTICTACHKWGEMLPMFPCCATVGVGRPRHVLDKLNIDSSVHGFRTSFRRYALEEAGVPWAVAEAALPHTLGNSVEQAYIRSGDPFEQRQTLMQQWADHCQPAG